MVFKMTEPAPERTAYKCKRCGHVWLRLASKEAPVFCARCKSPYWNRERQITEVNNE